MNSSQYPQITDEMLSAYIDNAVTEDERRLIERAMASDPDVAWRLQSLQHTVHLLKQMPTVAVPRSFALPASVGFERQSQQAASPRRAAPQARQQESTWDQVRRFLQGGSPLLRNAAAVSLVLFLVLLLGGDWLLTNVRNDPRLAQSTAPSVEMAESEGMTGSAAVESAPAEESSAVALVNTPAGDSAPSAKDAPSEPSEGDVAESSAAESADESGNVSATGAAESSPAQEESARAAPEEPENSSAGSDALAQVPLPTEEAPAPLPTEPIQPELANMPAAQSAAQADESADDSNARALMVPEADGSVHVEASPVPQPETNTPDVSALAASSSPAAPSLDSTAPTDSSLFAAAAAEPGAEPSAESDVEPDADSSDAENSALNRAEAPEDDAAESAVEDSAMADAATASDSTAETLPTETLTPETLALETLAPETSEAEDEGPFAQRFEDRPILGSIEEFVAGIWAEKTEQAQSAAALPVEETIVPDQPEATLTIVMTETDVWATDEVVSVTDTMTATPTVTATVTPTMTPTMTPTGTPTLTTPTMPASTMPVRLESTRNGTRPFVQSVATALLGRRNANSDTSVPVTATATMSPTVTLTPTATATPTEAETETDPETPTATATPTITPTVTSTVTVSVTATITPGATISSTGMVSPVATAENAPTTEVSMANDTAADANPQDPATGVDAGGAETRGNSPVAQAITPYIVPLSAKSTQLLLVRGRSSAVDRGHMGRIADSSGDSLLYVESGLVPGAPDFRAIQFVFGLSTLLLGILWLRSRV